MDSELTHQPNPQLDIEANRRARKWTPVELLRRALWETLGVTLFAFSPRPLWAWRRALLRVFGARIGRQAHLHPTVRIAIPWNLEIGELAGVGERAILYSLGKIVIGRQATVSQYAHLCAGGHDHRRPDMALIRSPISINDGAWVCADAFVGPGVTVGEFAVVGACAVVVRDVPPRTVVAGNPAVQIGTR